MFDFKRNYFLIHSRPSALPWPTSQVLKERTVTNSVGADVLDVTAPDTNRDRGVSPCRGLVSDRARDLYCPLISHQELDHFNRKDGSLEAPHSSHTM